MKGSVLLVISLVLILVSVLVSGHVLPPKSTLSLSIALFSRVVGVICFLIGVLRIRREKQSA
jgi:hypothetical protein